MCFPRDVPRNLIIAVTIHTILGPLDLPSSAALNYFQQFIVPFSNESLYQHYGVVLDETGFSWLWSLLVTQTTIGHIVSACFIAWLLESLGRRNTIMILHGVILAISLLLQFFARYFFRFELFFFGRFLTGISSGLHSPTVLFLTECAPVQYRGASASIIHSGAAVYGAISVLLALPSLFANDEHWHYYFLVWIPLVLLYTLCAAFIPESPKYLYITRSDRGKAEQSIRFYQGDGVDIDAVLANYEQEHALSQSRHLIPMRVLWRTNHLRRPFIICTLATATTWFTGNFIMMEYMFPILAGVGIGQAWAVVAALLINSLGLPLAVVVQLYLVERLGRRPLLLTSIGIAITGLIAIFFAELFYPDQAALSFPMVIIFLLGTSGAGILGMAFLPAIIVGECCPQSIRTRVYQINSLLGSAFMLPAGLAYPPVHTSIGPATYLIFAVLSFGGLLWLYFNLPETKNRPVNEIVAQWRENSASESSSLLHANTLGLDELD